MVSRRKSIFEDCHDRKMTSFPEVSPIALSHSQFPNSYRVLEDSGQEFGFTLTPFIKNDSHLFNPEVVRRFDVAGKVARCSNNFCCGYLNPLCDATNLRWTCSLCFFRNQFSKAQTRYRHTELKSMPELQDPLVDYRMPISDKAGTQQDYDSAVYGATAKERPFVHVFVVQESMKLDSLQSTIEALTAAVAEMHSEIEIVLITFSHRIGIYRFSKGSLVPSVQYIHFLAAPTSIATRQSTDKIFEGHDLQQLDPEHQIRLMMPISAVQGFRETACPIGECRDAFVGALSSLFDAFPTDTSALTDADERLPKVLIGPTLEALSQWLTTHPADVTDDIAAPAHSTYTDADHFQSPAAGTADLTTLLSSLTLGLWSSVVGAPDSGNNASSSKATRGEPIDVCTGVVIHLFLDAAQDIRYGAHASAGEPLQAKHNPRHLHLPTTLDAQWVQHQADRLAAFSATVNVWSIVNFESHEVGLSSLQPLCETTGGAAYRIVLGHHPAQERARLTEMLRRKLTTIRATRGVLKMRGSPLLDFVPELASGGLVPDAVLPGVYRVASCTPDSTFGMCVKYNTAHAKGTQVTDNIVLQMAFSYETLAATAEPLLPEDSAESKEPQEEECDGAILYTDSSDEEYMGRSSKQSKGTDAAATTRKKAADCGMLTDPQGYYEQSVGALGMQQLHEQVARYYHIADATVQCRRQAGNPQYAARSRRGFLLSQHTNRPADLDKTRKLIVVKYLRVFTIVVECIPSIPKLFLDSNSQTQVLLYMRRALQLERQHRLSHRYTSQSISLTAEASQHPAITAFASKINMQSPGVSYLVNSLVKCLIQLIHHYAVEKKIRRKEHDEKLKGSRSSPNTVAEDSLDTIMAEVLADSTVKDRLIYTFAAIDKLTFCAPLIANRVTKAGASVKVTDDCAYLSDEGAAFESQVGSGDGYNLARLLHPLLVPVSADLLLGENFLSLTRRSTVMCEQPCFLLDAGTEVLLYRGAGSMANMTTMSTHSATGGTGGPGQHHDAAAVSHLLAVCPMEESVADGCIHAAAQARVEYPTVVQADDADITEQEPSTAPTGRSRNSKDKAKLGIPNAPRVVSLMYDNRFLLGYLQRRLMCSELVPRVQVCDAGSATASLFAAYLLEDHSRSGLLYSEFVDFIGEVVKRDMV